MRPTAGVRTVPFDLLLSRIGLGALAVTAGFGIASFITLTVLRTQVSPDSRGR